jgi:putative transposase
MAPDHDSHAQRLRAGRFSAPFQTYFITKCTEGRCSFLTESVAAETVIQSLDHVRRMGYIKLLAFVIMPDHYHTIFTLLDRDDLSGVMRRIGSFTANRIRKVLRLQHAVWQDDGFYDRACRDDAEVYEIVEYVHHNPVRRGLVTSPEQWLFSSAHPTRSYLVRPGIRCAPMDWMSSIRATSVFRPRPMRSSSSTPVPRIGSS